MTVEVAITVLTSLVGISVAIMTAGIPWAYCVHGRLTKIEATLNDHLVSVIRLSKLENRVLRLELEREADRPTEK